MELFVEEGAKVVIAGRREVGEALAKTLGPAARFIRTDVTKEHEVKTMLDHGG
jgi:NAD(P)-dependent dehydrogenase (short-subunit alcohol dehydrogenase family)